MKIEILDVDQEDLIQLGKTGPDTVSSPLELALDLGAREVFAKPIDSRELCEAVKDVLRF